SLVVSKDSFVDKELREHFSDIIYQVDLKQGDSAYIYLLFEHKSYSDPLIALHLLRYMIKIWEQGVKQGKARPFSPIIPIVVYHGKSKWKAGPDFYALFDLPDGLQVYMPNFRYLLCDLSHSSDEEVKLLPPEAVACFICPGRCDIFNIFYPNSFICLSSISLSFLCCHFTYFLIRSSSNPTVLTQYPRDQKMPPPKLFANSIIFLKKS
ncbi:MAG: Rpn family recombination-promoting nuclease/putative transposase, partial [Deltaproteobacteria bacterium]|nr:Rpn family recombination-promoting nuclease/putative transposase [Deltaproteobacteria bacterium]